MEGFRRAGHKYSHTVVQYSEFELFHGKVVSYKRQMYDNLTIHVVDKMQ